jgi:hypothetical protein
MTATALASYALALTFAWASATKLLRFSRWRRSLEGYGLRGTAADVVAAAVPPIELALAVLLVVGFRPVGAALSLALLATFSAAILRAARTRGSRLPCGCFGGDEARDYRLMLLRNAALGLLAAVILLGDRYGALRPLDGTIDPVPLALSVVGAAAICWTIWQVVSSLRGRRHS